MYQFSYAEVQQDDVAEAKERERQLLDRAIELLTAARQKGPNSREAIDAVYFVSRMWIRFIEDLGSAENEMAQTLRADLISIGIWTLKELERIRKRESDNFAGVIDILTIIRDGLK